VRNISKKKKIKIEKKDENFYILYRISKIEEGNYQFCKLKHIDDLLKDSVNYNTGWTQLITNTFLLMRNAE